MIERARAAQLTVAGRRLEVLTIAQPGTKASIVLLHEGLGSVSAWRTFPAELAAVTGRSVIAYSRAGYGSSEPLTSRRDVQYMHVEGHIVLPALIAALGLRTPVVFGHSDGASIALLYAGRHPHAARALVLEAPHVFVEDVTVTSIARVKATHAATGLIDKLARHHADAEGAFWGWNDIWLDPAFRTWNIAACLPSIVAPTLVIQSRDDEYGTLAQLDAITSVVPHSETLVLEHGGHSPHRIQTAAVLERTAAFLAPLD